LRFLGILLKVLKLEVSAYTMFTLQTSFKPILLDRAEVHVKSVSKGDCEEQGGKLLRLLSQLRPRISALGIFAKPFSPVSLNISEQFSFFNI
jgi:hypothetical protein